MIGREWGEEVQMLNYLHFSLSNGINSCVIENSLTLRW
jgi:hypothetical protein